MKKLFILFSIAATILSACKKQDEEPKVPVHTATTGEANSITSTSAVVGAFIKASDGSAFIASGICWSTSHNPTSSLLTKITWGGGNMDNFGTITGLSLQTTYYVRSFVTNATGTFYGNEIQFTTILEIGSLTNGGIVAYILQQGDLGYDAHVQHGLVAAPSDQSSSIVWSPTATLIATTSSSLGSGQINTTAIITNQGDGDYAAKLCDDLTLNGYSDWYLPSADELDKLFILYQNLQTTIGFDYTLNYWSSSQYDTNGAWSQKFNSGTKGSNTKLNTYAVRAVRSF
ncbi:DUF1566 domain-containing protein [uncultured Cytophaga sp.]|uniref:Lcl C-terminal domain-containing protein n=1 Tax=uncultured Cytophaga sp. TaxID=160238 RepID=UPI00261AFAE9|nr:DUF1566 domain-containing protein [uncultured Cytophaga sp.]